MSPTDFNAQIIEEFHTNEGRVAGEATGEERQRLYRTQVERVPQFGEYEKTAGEGVIPVIILTPTRAG